MHHACARVVAGEQAHVDFTISRMFAAHVVHLLHSLVQWLARNGPLTQGV
eukprot:COSAG01_NODE_71107_length_257_cov_0.506329_1_plen_49_part_10